ncbi:hypothetical protein [Brevibacterium aurantiacum]|uniref:hypothetical protein n=1 Tax=Brevibacterium aurantiacum TaxID=273384 RepID=UPI001868E56C|nr:hypothetical protein [Brevibacterium aurantiacum]
MNSSDILTVIAAILGSGALATVIQLTASRFRVDRRADLIRSWKEESDIADQLYKQAVSVEIASDSEQVTSTPETNSSDSHNDNENSTTATSPSDNNLQDTEIASRNSRIAFSRAVRTDLNKRLASELVPSNAMGLLFSYLIALASSLGGLFIAVTGVYLMSTANNQNSNPPFSAGVLVLIYGVMFIITGIGMFVFLNAVEQSRMRARRIILDVLNIDSPGIEGKIKDENNDLVFVGLEPKLFMKIRKQKPTAGNADKSTRPTLLRRALGKDLAYNLETFIRQTTKIEDFDSPVSVASDGS